MGLQFLSPSSSTFSVIERSLRHYSHEIQEQQLFSYSKPGTGSEDLRKAERCRLDNMDAPTIQPKFLSTHDELGLVAVGFSGGQVHYG